MTKAIDTTRERRARQIAYNAEHGINPQTIRKAVGDILSLLRPDDTSPVPGKGQRRNRERDKVQRELKTGLICRSRAAGSKLVSRGPSHARDGSRRLQQ